MNAFFLDLVHDLRTTKLWPVAVGLLLAVVALPVFLLKSPTTPPDPVVPAVSGTGAQAAAVSLLDPGSARPSPLSAFSSKDPFSRPRKARSSSKDNAAGALAGSPASMGAAPGPGLAGGSGLGATGSSAPLDGTSLSGAASGSAGSPSPRDDSSTGGGSGSSGGSPLPSETRSPPVPGTLKRTHTTFTYVADVKVGPTDTERTFKDIESPKLLPSDANPLIVFLGATSDGKSALFMVDTSKLTSTGGKGECKPNPVTCSFLTLSTEGKNDLHLFEDNDGARYSLRLVDLHKKTLDRSSTIKTTPPAATGARSRGSGSRQPDPFAFPKFGLLFSR